MPAMKEKEKLIAIFESLPPESRHEVLDFADFLAQRKAADDDSLPSVNIDEAAGCLQYKGTAKSVQEMHEAIATGIKEKWPNQSV